MQTPTGHRKAIKAFKLPLFSDASKLTLLAVGVFLFTSVMGGFLLTRTPTRAEAAINEQLHFQARLLTSGGSLVPDGNYNVQFHIYSGGDGAPGTTDETLEWSGSYLKGNTQGIDVVNGYVSAQLGESASAQVNTLADVPWDNATLWLSINIGDTTSTSTVCTTEANFNTNCGGDGEMDSFIRLGSTPYAFNSKQLGGREATEFVQLDPGGTSQAINTANAVIDIDQAGAGALVNLEVSGSQVFGVANNGNVTTSGDLTVSGGSATLGADSQLGTLILSDGAAGASNHNVTIQAIASLGQDVTLTIPDGGNATDTLCTVQAANCSGAGSGDNITVNGSAATDANFLDVTADATTVGVTWNLNTVSNPDDITFALSAASASQAGILTSNAQTIGGTKTFAGNIVLGVDSTTTGSVSFENSTNANNLILQAGATGTADLTFTLPTAAPASNGQCLKSTTGGVFSFSNCNNGSGSGGSVTLQDAYDASTTPELTVDATNGALTVQDNSTPIGANLFEVTSNGGGVEYFAVSANQAVLGVDTQVFGDFDTLYGASSPYGGFGSYGNGLYVSEALDNGTYWSPTNITVTGDYTTAPDGTSTAERLVASAAGGYLTQTGNWYNSADTYTFSVWVKTDSGTEDFSLRIDGPSGTPATGTAATYSASTSWKRYQVTQTITGSPTSIDPRITITNNSGELHAWGAQLINRSYAGVYTSTNFGNAYGAVYSGAIASRLVVDEIAFGLGDSNADTYYRGDGISLAGGGSGDFNIDTNGVFAVSSRTSFKNTFEVDGNALADGTGGTVVLVGVDGATTQTAAIVGQSVDLSTNLTVPNSVNGNQTGILLTLQDGGASATAIALNAAGTGDDVLNVSGTYTNIINGTNVSLSSTGVLTLGATTNAGSLVLNDGSSNTATIGVQALAGNYTVDIPTITANDTFCLSNLGNCSGAGVALQSAYVGGNTITATNAEGDIDLTVSEATNFSVDITGTGSFLVQDGGANILGIADGGAVTISGDTTLSAGTSLIFTGDTTVNRPGSPVSGELFFDTDTDQLIQYNAALSKWQAFRGEYTIVAANDSSQAEKDAADYVADGINDETEINNALTAAAGGMVLLTGGNYTIDATILVPNDTVLSGVGRGTSLNSSVNNDNIIEATGASRTGQTIRNLTIDGTSNFIGSNKGIYFDGVGAGSGASARTGGLIEDVYVVGMTWYGIHLNDSDNNKIVNSTIQDNDDGIYIGANTTNNIIDSNLIQGNSGDGVYLLGAGASQNTFSNNTVQGNGGDGFELNQERNSVIGNNVIGNTGVGVKVRLSANYTIVSGNLINANNEGVYLNSADYVNVTSNYIYNSTSHGINIETTSNDHNISGNYIDSSGGMGIRMLGAGLRSTVDGNNVSNSTNQGIYLGLSDDNTVSNNTVYVSGDAGIQVGGDRNTIIGNTVVNSGGATANDGIYMNSSDATQVIGNNISDSSCTSTCRAIYIISSNKTYLADNRYAGSATDTASISDSGTNTIYANQQTNSTDSNNFDVGNFRYRGSVDSTTAFAFQNAAGSDLLVIDSTNGEIEVGSSALAGALAISDGSSNTATIRVQALAGNYTVDIPTITANDTFCLATAGNCSGAGVTLQSAYVGGNTITATNAEGDIDLTVSEATNFSVDITGTGSFLVQDGGTNIIEVASNGDVTFDNTDSTLFIDVSTNSVVLGDTNSAGALVINDGYGNTSDIYLESSGVGSGFLRFTAQGTNGTIAEFRDCCNAVFGVGETSNSSYFNYGLDISGTLDAADNVILGATAADLITVNGTIQGTNPFVFEGSSADAFETTLQIVNPTADITYQLANEAAGTYEICSTAGNCAGVAGNSLQQAYVAGNTILATNAEGDIDLTVSEATNFSVDITGTGSFLVQDGGSTVVEVAGDAVATGQTADNQVLAVNNTGATFDTTAGDLTSYGLYVTNTASESAGANVLANYGIYASATGGDNEGANVGVYGTGNTGVSGVGTGGALGLNTGVSGAGSLYGILGTSSTAFGGSFDGEIASIQGVVTTTDTTADTTQGIDLDVTDTGVVTTGTDTTYGLEVDVTRTGATGGTINTTGLDLVVTGDTGGTSTVTGLNVNVSGADTNYAAILQGGNVGIGVADPNAALEVQGNANISTSGGGNAIEFRNAGTYGTTADILLTAGGGIAAESSLILNIDTLNNGTGDTFSIRCNGEGLTGCVLFSLTEAGNATLNGDLTVDGGNVLLSDGSSNYATLGVQALAGNYTVDIPTITANDTFCLLTANNCSGISPFTTASNITYLTQSADQLSIGISTDINGKLQVVGDDATESLAVFRAAASQSSPLMVFQNSAGTELFRIDGDVSSIFIGQNAGTADDGDNSNYAFGRYALESVIGGTDNIAIGRSALNSTTAGIENVAVGNYSLQNIVGQGNVALGQSALSGAGAGTADNNTAIGRYSLQYVTTGDNNTALGRGAGLSVDTGSNNILLGYQAGDNLTTGSNNIIIGYDLDASAIGVSNELRIGGVLQGDTSTLAAQFNGTLSVQDTILLGQAAQTKAAWGTSGIQLQTGATTYTDSSTAASGTATNAVFNSFATPTLAASNTSVTTTNASTVYIQGAPTVGTNQTITNAYSLWVDGGLTRLDGGLEVYNDLYVGQNASWFQTFDEGGGGGNDIAVELRTNADIPFEIKDGTGSTLLQYSQATFNQEYFLVNGRGVFSVFADSTTAFRVEDADDNDILTVDTTNDRTIFGSDTVAGQLRISDGSSNYATLGVQALAGNYTVDIPTITANDTFCLVSLANCSGGSGAFTSSAGLTRLNTTTDTVTIGSTTAGGKLFVDGDADEVQLQVQANGTQTANILEVSNSTGSTDYVVVDSSGVLLVGNVSAQGTTKLAIDAQAQIVGNNLSTGIDLDLYNWNNGGGGDISRINLYNSRGNQSTPTATQAEDVLGQIGGGGYSASYNTGGLIQFVADAEWGTAGDNSDLPTRIVFRTASDGNASVQERLRIGSDGKVTLPAAGTANASLQFGTNAFRLQSSVWDTTNTVAENRNFDIRTIAGSGADGSEPYRLAFENNNGTEFVTFDGLNERVGIGDPSPDGKLEVRQTAAADIFNLYDNTTNVLSVTDGGDILVLQDGNGAADGTGGDLILGAGNDAAIWYDGTDLRVDTSLVGTGDLSITGGDVRIGTSDTTGDLLILDTKTNAGDPTGTAGAMYYNSNSGSFRCYTTAWGNCDGAGGSTTTANFTPEYAGGILNADGSNNSGTMGSGWVNALSAAEGEIHNYYEWSTSQSTAQDYDIVVRFQLPQNFSSMGAASTFKFWHEDPDGATTNASTTWTVYDEVDETQCFSTTFQGTTAGVWEEEAASSLGTCSWSAGEYVTMVFKVQTTTGAGAIRLGEVEFQYDI